MLKQSWFRRCSVSCCTAVAVTTIGINSVWLDGETVGFTSKSIDCGTIGFNSSSTMGWTAGIRWDPPDFFPLK